MCTATKGCQIHLGCNGPRDQQHFLLNRFRQERTRSSNQPRIRRRIPLAKTLPTSTLARPQRTACREEPDQRVQEREIEDGPIQQDVQVGEKGRSIVCNQVQDGKTEEQSSGRNHAKDDKEEVKEIQMQIH